MNNIKLLTATFNELKQDTTKTGKERIILNNLDNQLFVKSMQFLVNPFIVSGLSKKKINKKVSSVTLDELFTIDNLSDMLDYLADNNTGTDLIISQVQNFIQTNVPLECQETISELFTKSLKIGVDSLWNKTVPNNLKVPEFGCMLAKSYYDHKNKVEGNFVITQKLDGNRILIVKDSPQGAKAFTRTGKEYEGLEVLLDEVNSFDLNGFVLDGELIANVDGDSLEVFSETQSLARSKDKNKQGLTFYVFDILSTDDFKKGKSFDNAIRRKERLHNFMSEFKNNLSSFKEVEPLYIGYETDMIEELMTELVEPNGWEGLMINLDKPYTTKRTDSLLKVKKFHTVDLRIIGFEEGDGKYKGTLGAIHVDYKGYDVGCGSGFTDEQREYFWSNKEDLLGRVVEIKFFEESKNKDGGISLRFPTFVRLREEDKKVSYN